MDTHKDPTGGYKPFYIIATVVIALVGFIVGTRRDAYVIEKPPPRVEKPRLKGDAPEKTYKDLLEKPLEKNQAWQTQLGALAISADKDVAPQTEEDRLQAVQKRAERRAFQGAPPMIPHPIKPSGALSCMACHEKGMKLGKRVASPMSHGYLASCTQCHAPMKSSVPFEEERAEEIPLNNLFVGLAEAPQGQRAWEGAPPTIPHGTWMRQNCMSCHGPGGKSGMKTTHPWRTSCLQCHAPDATLEQAPTSSIPTFPSP